MIKISKNYNCPVCDKKVETLINLEEYPLTEIYQKFNENNFTFKPYVNQEFKYCENCDHGFLGNHLPQDFLYNEKNYFTAFFKSNYSK